MLNDKAKNFCKYLGIAKARGFDPLVVLTHAWHESAGFTRVIGVSNVWGIKAPANIMRWSGLVVERWTHEDERVRENETPDQALARCIGKYGTTNLRVEQMININNKKYWHIGIAQKFRDWAGFHEAIPWYCDFIARVYPDAFEHRGSNIFFPGLISGEYKYATDPAYIPKLMAMYKSLAQNKEILDCIEIN